MFAGWRTYIFLVFWAKTRARSSSCAQPVEKRYGSDRGRGKQGRLAKHVRYGYGDYGYYLPPLPRRLLQQEVRASPPRLHDWSGCVGRFCMMGGLQGRPDGAAQLARRVSVVMFERCSLAEACAQRRAWRTGRQSMPSASFMADWDLLTDCWRRWPPTPSGIRPISGVSSFSWATISIAEQKAVASLMRWLDCHGPVHAYFPDGNHEESPCLEFLDEQTDGAVATYGGLEDADFLWRRDSKVTDGRTLPRRNARRFAMAVRLVISTSCAAVRSPMSRATTSSCTQESGLADHWSNKTDKICCGSARIPEAPTACQAKVGRSRPHICDAPRIWAIEST